MKAKVQWPAYLNIPARSPVALEKAVILAVVRQLKDKDGYFGLTLDDRHCFQAHLVAGGKWDVEFLDTELCNLRYAKLGKKALGDLVTRIYADPDPVSMLDKVTDDWEFGILTYSE